MQPLIYRSMSHKTRKRMAVDALHEWVWQTKSLICQINYRWAKATGGYCWALVTHHLTRWRATGNLDSRTTEDIMHLFDELHREGHTIVLVPWAAHCWALRQNNTHRWWRGSARYPQYAAYEKCWKGGVICLILWICFGKVARQPQYQSTAMACVVC